MSSRDVQEFVGDSSVSDVSGKLRVLSGKFAVPVLGRFCGRRWGAVRGVLARELQGSGGFGELRDV
jgi:hypothetical protein